VDDDLLAIPPDIGERKSAAHNSAERLASVRFLLEAADLIYASTDRLRAKLLEYFPASSVLAGKIYCSGSVIRRPNSQPARKIGYMASADHAHNLDMVLPAIERLLDRNPQIAFELFGSIPIPPQLHRFGDRIKTEPPVANYAKFLEEFAGRQWDIGICPLTPIDFNLMKANTKWVEYTSAGVAVIASRGTVYDDCCADGCGMLADGTDDWLEKLEFLMKDDQARLAMAQRAQSKLEREYGLGRLREQVLDVMSKARQAATDRLPNRSSKDFLACQTA